MKITDGILEGEGFRIAKCEVCGALTASIRIDKCHLPPGIYPTNRLIFFKMRFDGNISEPSLIRRIGVGCGCYARAHRQLGIIESRTKHRKR